MTQIDDIEDIGAYEANGKRLARNEIIARVRKRHKSCSDEVGLEADSFIPGTHRIFMKTWGCAHNSSDSEYMAGLLAANGYDIVNEPNSAHLWLLNSCTVKSPSEHHFRNEVNKGLQSGKYVVVAGCVPQSSPRVDYVSGLSVVGVQQIDRVVEVVEETLKGNTVRLLAIKKDGKRKTGGASLHMPKIRRNPLIEIIAINTGCLNECTYCKTKHARGKLGSYAIEDIVGRAVESFREGVKEIWLTSEDTGAYGRDIGTSLPQLLYALIDVIPNDCMLRLGMTNPPYILEHLEAMANIMSNPRVYSFLHIPVQAASDSVLADMKREYCIEDFCHIVDYLRAKVKGITIATDIICGFPTETATDFEETLNLVDKYKFPVLFINQFYPRPGTPAAKMNRVPTQEVKRRSKALSELFALYKPYEHRIGREEYILVTEESHDKRHYVGHNKYYEQILIPKYQKYLGKMIRVRITSTGKHYMIGVPIECHNYAILNSLAEIAVMLTRDVEIMATHAKHLLSSKHVQYLQQYANSNNKGRDESVDETTLAISQLSYEQLMVEHLRISGIYWTITALHLMQFDFNTDAQQNVLSLIRCCVDSKGGVSASVGHDPHILYTLSAIQIIAELNAFDHNIIDTDKTVSYISSLQRSDGSFSGDMWGEVDVRFSFCAIASLALLKRLNAIDLRKAVDFIMSCYNTIDGGFGSRPGSESHAGLIYCCLGSLSIAGELDRIDADQLGWWLAERQLPSGGLNGRPEKLPDLCYSWWVLASLAIIGRLHWIDKRKLTRFILACQDDESGGFSDRPGNLVDPFHTHFGIAGLSLLAHEDCDDTENRDNGGEDDEYDHINGQLETIRDTVNVVNPVFCMPQSVIDRYDIKLQLLSL